MDNWAAAFTTITMYAAVRASKEGEKRGWWVLFGLMLGLTVASRINMAPLAAMAGVAAIIWLSRHYKTWGDALTDKGATLLQTAVIVSVAYQRSQTSCKVICWPPMFQCWSRQRIVSPAPRSATPRHWPAICVTHHRPAIWSFRCCYWMRKQSWPVGQTAQFQQDSWHWQISLPARVKPSCGTMS